MLFCSLSRSKFSVRRIILNTINEKSPSGIWHFQLDCLWLGHLPHLPGVQQHPTGAPVTVRTIQMMRDNVKITCVPHVDVASQVITYNCS